MLSTVPEVLLIRDCLHCCQGGQGGRFVGFTSRLPSDTNEKQKESVGDTKNRMAYDVLDEYRMGGQGQPRGGSVVPVPQRQLIWKITEVGRLMRQMNDLMLLGGGAGEESSIVHDAVKAACQKEMRSCYRLIAVLEGQSHDTRGSEDRQVGNGNGMEQTLTLRRTLVWLDEMRQRLEIVARCLEAVMGVPGGEALNALYSMSKHGDPFVVQTIAPLLNAASAPYFMQLEQWMTQGVVPRVSAMQRGGGIMSSSKGVKNIASGQKMGEFMILKLRTPKDHPYDDWKEGFDLDKSAQPKSFDAALSRDILNVGKAVYFLRKYCDGDDDWNDALSQLQHAGQLMQVSLQCTARQRFDILKQLVQEAKSVMDEKLVYVVRDKERLFSHLENIKRFVLLSKGDFVRTFIDLADEDLSAPVSQYSEYVLQGHVEKALQACDAIDVEINRDLVYSIQVQQVQENQYSAATDIGWHAFGLGYSLPREDSPVAAILDTNSMKLYGEISSILWSLKRAEHITGLCWHRLESTSHDLNSLRSMEREHGIELSSIIGNAPALLRSLHSLRTEIAQFVNTLQSHIVYRVIEPAWKSMISELMVAKNLDGLLEAHSNALKKIAQGTFNEKKKSLSGTSTSDIKATLKAALGAAMDVYVPVDTICSIVEDAVRSQHKYLSKVRESERLGVWNEDQVRNSPSPISDETLEDIKRSSLRLYSMFSRHRDMFYSSLPSAIRENLRR